MPPVAGMRSPLGLRAAILSLFGVLIPVALLAAGALVGMTTALGRATAEVALADAQMRASLRTKSALLWYARESDVAILEGTPEARARQASAEAELMADVADTRRLATPGRTAQLDSLVQRVSDYVSFRKSVQQEDLPLVEVLGRATPMLEPVFLDLQRLVTSDDAWARSVERSARQLHTLAEVVGIGAGALLLVGFAGAFIHSERLLERPLLTVREAIARFGAGDRAVRAPLEGPRELREIASNFNELADLLARREKERLAFLAGVAHDLRNPLTPLKLAVGRARAESQTTLSPEGWGKLLDVVDRQAARLDRMVGDLLDATRIESGELELHEREFDLGKLLTGVADLYRPTSEIHRIEVEQPQERVVVSADPLRVEQVLINLVSNAIKYSPEGGLVMLALSRAPGEAIVTVADEGIGVAPEERERIFEPFHRSGRSRGEKIPGVGLGLAVARRIAVAHGGRLELVESERGSKFRLTLPA